jgi:hypothetical protein
MSDQYLFDFTSGDTAVAMTDTFEETVFVMSIDQVEALLEWYCKKFDKIVI